MRYTVPTMWGEISCTIFAITAASASLYPNGKLAAIAFVWEDKKSGIVSHVFEIIGKTETLRNYGWF